LTLASSLLTVATRLVVVPVFSTLFSRGNFFLLSFIIIPPADWHTMAWCGLLDEYGMNISGRSKQHQEQVSAEKAKSPRVSRRNASNHFIAYQRNRSICLICSTRAMLGLWGDRSCSLCSALSLGCLHSFWLGPNNHLQLNYSSNMFIITVFTGQHRSTSDPMPNKPGWNFFFERFENRTCWLLTNAMPLLWVFACSYKVTTKASRGRAQHSRLKDFEEHWQILTAMGSGSSVHTASHCTTMCLQDTWSQFWL